ncbi:hypothetical protein [Candidatus Nitrosotenuis uzonensis]|uniref:Uncharacterized protein n=1 Tax=Candidatus Nitrosotenuis uzonensis TaxID=1407055 RepID=A0A812F471_9ARCH|nr:hypothetical protein [Candidatus Nitrosotenuis uzonensis]CAE6487147.1 conserved exported hypothetical protein [Candidatus Nitrosotenuis uzonensis]
MNARIVGISVVVAVAIALVSVFMFAEPIDVVTPQENPFAHWYRSGPFAIDKKEYKIGENIFIAVEGLRPYDKGNMVFVMPNGTTKYITIPFNGEEKSGFNQYFKPAISKFRKICSTNDLVGDWTVVFQGTNYKELHFTMLNETLDSSAPHFERVC